jgi:cytochrome c oxidase subunit 3
MNYIKFIFSFNTEDYCLPNATKKIKNKFYFKEDFQFIKTKHSFHLVDPSPWPLTSAFGVFMLTTGGVLYMHKFIGGERLFLTGLIVILYTMYTWWRDVIREATFEEQHTLAVQRGLRLGMLLFIVSEIMFFFAFFWAFFHSSLAPVFNIGGVWPPEEINPIATLGVPLTNTFFLLSSGATVTWAHHAIIVRAKRQAIIALIFTLILAILFTSLQVLEYEESPFNISDSVFGSCFYMATGFHGFHVFIGTLSLLVSLLRIIVNHFTSTHHFGFESAAWYWHFVDVVWLFLFISVYWWGGVQSNY